MNTALPSSLGKPISPRTAAITPSMLIGTGRPTAPVRDWSRSPSRPRRGRRRVRPRQPDRGAGRAGGRGACAGGVRIPALRRPSSRHVATSRSAACAREGSARLPPRASTTAPMASIDDSTAAPWNSPSARRPAAVPAWRRGTARDRGPGGEGGRGAGSVIDARHHHRVDQSGRRGIGQLPGEQEVDDGGKRDRADELGELVAANRDAFGRGLGERGGPVGCRGRRTGCDHARAPFCGTPKKTVMNCRLDGQPREGVDYASRGDTPMTSRR